MGWLKKLFKPVERIIHYAAAPIASIINPGLGVLVGGLQGLHQGGLRGALMGGLGTYLGGQLGTKYLSGLGGLLPTNSAWSGYQNLMFKTITAPRFLGSMIGSTLASNFNRSFTEMRPTTSPYNLPAPEISTFEGLKLSAIHDTQRAFDDSGIFSIADLASSRRDSYNSYKPDYYHSTDTAEQKIASLVEPIDTSPSKRPNFFGTHENKTVASLNTPRRPNSFQALKNSPGPKRDDFKKLAKRKNLVMQSQVG